MFIPKNPVFLFYNSGMNFISAIKFHHLRTPLTVFKICSSKLWIRQLSTESDSPIKYSGSRAAGWKAEYTRRGAPKEDETPWYQPYIISSSFAAFLLYFCILREENDVDEKLDISLYDRIEGLEKTQLKSTLEYYKEKGIDSEKVRKRLEELEMNDVKR